MVSGLDGLWAGDLRKFNARLGPFPPEFAERRAFCPFRWHPAQVLLLQLLKSCAILLKIELIFGSKLVSEHPAIFILIQHINLLPILCVDGTVGAEEPVQNRGWIRCQSCRALPRQGPLLADPLAVDDRPANHTSESGFSLSPSAPVRRKIS